MVVKTHVPYSKLLNEPRTVLAELERGDVVLDRRDDVDLVLSTAPRQAAAEASAVLAARLLRAVAGREPDLLAALLADDLTWLYWLPDDEKRQCREELVANLVAGLQTGHWEPFARVLTAWQSTAEVWSDPQLARTLAQEFPGDGPELARPGEAGS